MFLTAFICFFSVVWKLPKGTTCRRSYQEVEAKRFQCFGENLIVLVSFNSRCIVRRYKNTALLPFLQTITPLEHCQWLNKLLSEIWLNYMNKKLSLRFASMVEVSEIHS